MGQLRSLYQRIIRGILFVIFIAVMAMPLVAFADSGDATIKAPKTLGSVKVTEQSYFDLEKASVLPSQGEGNNIIFTVSLYNGEDHDLFMKDYWIYLITGTNTQIPLHLVSKDREKNRVSPYMSEKFTYYATLKSNAGLEELTFKFIKWDIAAKGFERQLGSIQVPAADLKPALADAGSKVIDISGISVSTSVYQVQISQNDKNLLTLVTFELENKGNIPVTVPDYQYMIQTPDGSNYRMIVQDSGSVTISPLSKKKLLLYAELPAAVKTFSWQLIVTQLDPVSKIMMPVAQYGVSPSKFENLIAVSNDRHRIEISDTSLNTSITNVLVNHGAENDVLVFNFELENEGNRLVKIPALSFSIRTKEGLLYPAVVGNTEGLSIPAHDSKDISLSASIPSVAGLEGLELILNQPLSADAKSAFPWAVYPIPNINNTAVYADVETGFSIQKKAFNAMLNGLNRYPWGEEDALIADISVSNKGEAAVAVPSFEAYFLLDGKVKINAKVLMTENVVTMKENVKSHLMLIGKLPYTSEFSTIQLVLLNEEKDKTLTPLVEFTNKADYLEVPIVAEGAANKLTDKGRKASLKVHGVRTYEGIGKHILYVEFELENQEKRFADPLAFVAYFKTQDDLYFPLKVTSVNQKISPNGKVLLAGWASMPQSYQLKDLELMLGQGVAGNAFVSENGTPDALVKAVKYKLPAENSSYQTNLANVELYPYSTTMNKMFVMYGSLTDSIDIKFDYKLNKNSMDTYENQISGHKLLFEFVEGSSDTKFTSELSLEAGSGNVLQLGNHSTTITFTDPGLWLKLKRFDSYTINLYDQYQGVNKLIASKSFRWFQLSD